MATDHPFYMWSLAEAWQWLINLPVLGFVILVVLGVLLALLFVAFVIYVDMD